MDEDIESVAEAIHRDRPVTLDGTSLTWEAVVKSHPERAAEYREAARNRIRAEKAMKRLADPTHGLGGAES